MDTSSQNQEERTYDVRILSHPKVRQALEMEQANRYGAAKCVGPKPRKVDILADWVEAKADSIIGGKESQ